MYPQCKLSPARILLPLIWTLLLGITLSSLLIIWPKVRSWINIKRGGVLHALYAHYLRVAITIQPTQGSSDSEPHEQSYLLAQAAMA
jgi:hypothetical protein